MVSNVTIFMGEIDYIKPITVFIILMLLFSTITTLGVSEEDMVDDNGLMDSAWPMFQHDPQHTGRTDVILPSGNQGVLKWKYLLLDRGMESTPVIDKDGTIYVWDNTHNIYAIYPNGTLNWRCELEAFTDKTVAIAADGASLPAFTIFLEYQHLYTLVENALYFSAKVSHYKRSWCRKE